MKMEDQYCISDLQQLMSSSSRPQPQQFPAIRPPDLFSGHRNLTSPPQPYDVMMAVGMSRGLHPAVGAGNSASPAMAAASSATSSLGGLEMEAGPFGIDGGSGRWPRQETLTLLEIRSRLDSKFREANQKGPLWDEVSRIMSEEHGYQRSGKKCREKFENLYKYYKKTKEGKAGRQDGKHYRFFRQLEALYGEASNSASASETQAQFQSTSLTPLTNYQDQTAALLQTPKLCDSLSLSYSSDFNSSSSDDDMNNALMDNDSAERGKKRRNVRRGWKAKIKDFIDSQMRKLMEKQEAWLEKMMKSIERREQERSLREEEWRREEAERFEKERRVWASERARIEARDAALMDALHKLTGAKTRENRRVEEENNGWEEPEITRLIHVRTSMEARFQESGGSDEVIWEEIAAKMSCLGYERTGTMCKGKWDSINDYLRKTNSYKKRKENITRSSSNFSFYQNPNDSFYNEERVYCNQTRPPTSETAANCNNVAAVSVAGNPENDICFPFLMGDGGNLWENYGVKINKGDSP